RLRRASKDVQHSVRGHPSKRARKRAHLRMTLSRWRKRGAAPAHPLPSSRRLRGFLCWRRLLHGAHVEVEHAFALVALFFVLLAKFDDLFEDLDVEPLALGLREHFLLLLV